MKKVTVTSTTWKTTIEVDEKIFDFRKQEIQDLLKRDFDIAVQRLVALGKAATGTIKGGPYCLLEHKGGNIWAHRIYDSSMKKLQGMSKSLYKALF